MDPAMDQTLQALQALYSSPDPATKKQADDWLTQFQQTPVAWTVSDQVLTRPETPSQFKFFAAQTMRTKVQFDFHELPAESYCSLRDSIVNHIERFSGSPESQPIHTMLAVTLADLVVQMDAAWPNAVGDLLKRYERPESYATLLEVLRMLPEETSNYKLMTDTYKRENSKARLRQATPQVVQFLLNLPCPSPSAKKKVLECFLSWIKFADLQAAEIANNPLIPECCKYVAEGGDLSEPATDIIIEILRMCSADLAFFQPVIQLVLSLLGGLHSKFDTLVARASENENSLLQICRIFVETGECLVPLIMEKSQIPEVLAILQVILRCTNLPNQEISSIPLDFWHRLANEVCRHPETDVKIDQFQSIYVELLTVVINRCEVPAGEDPFAVDDDFVSYRQQLKMLAEDCLEILTPNTALEHVLKSLQAAQTKGVSAQEAHFYCLTKVGERAEVREDSVLWHLIQSLPPLISQQVAEGNEAAMLHFTKKTAIELLGCLSKWVKTKPDFLRSALEMISTLLLQSAPPGAAPNVVERTKQVQQAASMSFKEICYSGRQYLQDFVPQLTQLYISTMQLPLRMHLFIVDGVGAVVAHLRNDADFQKGMEQLVMPLVNGLNSEREKPQVLSEILDRMTTIIRLINVQQGTSKAVAIGTLINNAFWPLIQQTLASHPGDPKVVEKSCRLLKHSMRCTPDMFKPNARAVAEALVTAFNAHQHSSYLYSAEILANTYANDPEIVPVLTQLFHSLSTTGLQCLVAKRDRLEEITELVEDFYGMFERYLRYCPMIVLEAPTLPATMQLWLAAIFVQQKDAIEAVIAFIEAVLHLIATAAKADQRFVDERRARHGQLLRPHALQVCPGFVEAIFRLIAGVPTRYVQESIPAILDCLRGAFPQEFPSWLQAGLLSLPPSVASQAERQKIGEQLLAGDEATVYDAMHDLCYRCEQVALRSRGSGKK
eukprot:TRINITY_DN13693_c0_g1_i1.p1 TRINITY_DN13693_c0_g1~~TRINITY_DN13693_c0_g1_i1.p1  ORF type:complete len:950 (+),score=239.04 TRINITY_DN13693_c0_g1_i1:119-2968(+)